MWEMPQIRRISKQELSHLYFQKIFEHIPADILPAVVDNLYQWLQPGGLAVVGPHVYTGISGGHDPDYYPHRVMNGSAPKEYAWRHLWDPNFQVDTYLNKLGLDDYVRLFQEKFDILECTPKYAPIGESYLTDEIRNKLSSSYTDEQLFTNNVHFVLRSK
jgi:hypothetical protein